MTRNANTWPKGRSGNPKGRPRGTSAAAQLRTLIEKDGPNIVRALITKAVDDQDVQAMGILLDRVLPRLKPEAPAVVLPAPAESTAAPLDRANTVIEAVFSGRLSPEAGKELLQGLLIANNLAGNSDTDAGMKTIEELDKIYEAAMREMEARRQGMLARRGALAGGSDDD